MNDTHEVERLPGEWNIHYEYSIGKSASAFFRALRQQRILASECASCARLTVPPKSFCEFCFVPITELVEVGQEGRIDAVTVVVAPFKGGPAVPYCVAYVTLDGATSSMANYVRGIDLDDMSEPPPMVQVGSRVKVVFTDRPVGRITDFWFEPV